MMTKEGIDLPALDRSDNEQVLWDHWDRGPAWRLLVDYNHFGRLQVAEAVSPVEVEGNSLRAAGHWADVDMHSDDPLLPSSCSNIMG